MIIRDLPPERQEQVYVIDSCISSILVSPEQSILDVIKWFNRLVIDNMRTLLMGYHEGYVSFYSSLMLHSIVSCIVKFCTICRHHWSLIVLDLETKRCLLSNSREGSFHDSVRQLSITTAYRQ